MGTFLVFILKSSACLILFYLLYKLVLSRNTFQKANRCILFGIYTLVLLLPRVEMKNGAAYRHPLHHTRMGADNADDRKHGR